MTPGVLPTVRRGRWSVSAAAVGRRGVAGVAVVSGRGGRRPRSGRRSRRAVGWRRSPRGSSDFGRCLRPSASRATPRRGAVRHDPSHVEPVVGPVAAVRRLVDVDSAAGPTPACFDRLRLVAVIACEGGLELGRVRRREARVGREDGLDPVEPGLVALDELDLELDEPADDPAPGDRVDLVEADLDGRPVALEVPLPAELADRHDLDERRVAALLEDQRAGVGRAASRAAARSGRPGPRAPRGDGSRRPSTSRRTADLTETVVALAVCRSRAANPARASAPSTVSM